MWTQILYIGGLLVLLPVLFGLAYYLVTSGKRPDQVEEEYAGSKESKSVFIKKYPEANINDSLSQYTILALGLIFSISVAFVAFAFPSYEGNVDAFSESIFDDDFEVEPPPTEQVKPPPPPPPPPPPEIEVVDDEEILEEEPEIEDIEIEDDEVVEVPEVIEEEVVEEPEFFTIVEDMPLFPGCEGKTGDEGRLCTDQKIQEFIQKNLVYPQMAIENDIEGTVFVRFLVDEEGDVIEVQLARGVDDLIDNAALNLINQMPNWTPGKQRGKPVRVQYIVPIKFKLG